MELLDSPKTIRTAIETKDTLEEMKTAHRAMWRKYEASITNLARSKDVSDRQLADIALNAIDEIMRSGDRIRACATRIDRQSATHIKRWFDPDSRTWMMPDRQRHELAQIARGEVERDGI